MTILDIPLKIAENLGLGSSEEQLQLTYDVREWERDCTENNSNKIKALHAKIHKGVLLRVFLPFIYIYVFKIVKEIMQPSKDQEYLFDDED